MAIDNALEGKPAYYGLLVGALLMVACFATAYYVPGGIADINKKMAGEDSELSDLGKKIENGRTAQRKLPQFREEIKRLELELEKLRRILPSSRNTEELIKKMKSLVDQGDFSLQDIRFPKLPEASGSDIYVEWPITVTVQGGYHNLAILFNRLSNFSRIVNVEQFSIDALPMQTEKTISCVFVAKTFVYAESKQPDASATGGKPGGAADAAKSGAPK
jgi:type IV pilus assembly protein PilO